MPWSDWEFWLVTSLAVAAAVVVLRPLLPTRREAPRCPGCPSETQAPRSATLTIEGTPAQDREVP
ncbi:MAG: hypothetical protein RLZZ558_417 [Planctomycetota bacterium]|jgi:hypothetical protein